jgi:hypothetical protein
LFIIKNFRIHIVIWIIPKRCVCVTMFRRNILSPSSRFSSTEKAYMYLRNVHTYIYKSALPQMLQLLHFCDR